MKYAVLIYNDPALLAAVPEQEFNETMRGCIDHADDLRAQGRLLDSQMLQPPATAKAIRVRNGRQTITDGPFAETKEMLAGFNLIEAESMEEAVRIAMAFPWSATGCVEVREIMDIADMKSRVSGVVT